LFSLLSITCLSGGEMNTATQPELLPETESDWINALTDEACRLHDAAVEAYGCGRGQNGHYEVN
jgi:hypothetical protein